MMEKPTCGTCAYQEHGLCKRYPPASIPHVRSGLVGGGHADHIETTPFPFYPQVENDDWCGEHPGFPEWAKAPLNPEPLTIDEAAARITWLRREIARMDRLASEGKAVNDSVEDYATHILGKDFSIWASQPFISLNGLRPFEFIARSEDKAAAHNAVNANIDAIAKALR